MNFLLVIRKLLSGNVQGVVFEGTPTREKEEEQVGTGSARSAGRPGPSVNHLVSLSLLKSLFQSRFYSSTLIFVLLCLIYGIWVFIMYGLRFKAG